jgi:hypothetical protein
LSEAADIKSEGTFRNASIDGGKPALWVINDRSFKGRPLLNVRDATESGHGKLAFAREGGS